MNKPNTKLNYSIHYMRAGLPAVILVALWLAGLNSQAEITGSGFHGVGCTGQIAVQLWLDSNGNQIQDDDENGLPGIDLNITRVAAPELGTDTLTTDEQGSILFYNLCMDAYDIQIVADTVPAGYQLGCVTDDDPVLDYWDSSTALNSLIVPLTDEDFGDNRSVKFGFTDTSCSLDVEVSCTIPGAPVPATINYQCDKPVEELNMFWNGQQNIRVVAHKGKVSDPIIADIDNVVPGMEVAIDGFEGSPNDIVWEIYAAGTNTKLGESSFHVSCSDPDMNGPEDCGLAAGDGKNNDKCDGDCLNDWLFEGLVDKSGIINCTVDEPTAPIAGGDAVCERSGPGAVDYQYSLINNSVGVVEVLNVVDSIIGELPGVPFEPMQPGEAFTYSFNDSSEQSVLRTLTVNTQEDNDQCTTSRAIGVSIKPLPNGCELMDVRLDKKSHDELKIMLTNTSDENMIVSSVKILWPQEHVDLKEVKLDGSTISLGTVIWSPLTTLSAADLKPEINKRTVKKNDEAKIEFKFDKHVHNSLQEYDMTVEFESGCTINYNDIGTSE